MEKKLKIGVFGGGRGITMIDALLKNEKDRAELVAVCDKLQPMLDRVKKAAEKAGVEVACYLDFEDFIKHDMDAVVLANYGHEHTPYAIRCMKMGKHVMSEVVPCETMAQAVELIEAVEETGMVYTYAENYCYMLHTFDMWRRYRKGEIGDILYAEGEYIHDIAKDWTRLCFGERDHWRVRAYATFYCTHSLGPIMYITGHRPVKVVGFETPLNPSNLEIGCCRGSGIEMVTLENGAVVKSIHGWMKREPSITRYLIYGQKGTMESGHLDGSKKMNVYVEGPKVGEGNWESYEPQAFVDAEQQAGTTGHGGSDFYPTHLFIEKILGRPNGDLAIDVYQAVDMGICGILAWRSILNGNVPIDVPNLRDPAQRDAFRNDHACTNPEVAGDQLVPYWSHEHDEIPDSVYDHLKELWEQSKDINGDVQDYT